jgi:hypothetical protein
VTITLYDTYPAEFGTTVNADAEPTFERSFKPDRLQLIQVRAPRPRTNTALLSQGSGSAACAPEGDIAGFAVGLEFSGTFTDSPSLPIAARVQWRPTPAARPLLTFPLVAGHGFFGFDGRERLTMIADGVLSPLAGTLAQQPQMTLAFDGRADGPSTLRMRFSNPLWLDELLPEDGTTAGVLELTADRGLALANHFERYAASFSRPVPLEVRTVEGVWVSSSSCVATVEPKSSTGSR